MRAEIQILAIATASILDFLIGDPWGWLHPVQVMGWLISWWRDFTFAHIPSHWGQKISGVFLNICLLGTSAGLGWGLVWLAYQVSIWLGLAIESMLLASCMAGRSLRNAADEVLLPLEAGDLVQARSQLSKYVGRDTQNLDQAGILRAVLETVAENTTDGAIAPLFYALIGGAPLALTYKAASTLDSMVGYIDPPYADFGWFSAKLEDGLSWIPCRLTVLAVGLLSGTPWKSWRICCRDAPQDPSPNSGWSEAVFAGALAVQLGGENSYRGQLKFKPLLGDPIVPITPAIVRRSLLLMRSSLLLLLCLGLLIRCSLIALT